MRPSSRPQGDRLTSRGVAPNYAIALFGVFVGPILIVALIFASRRRRSADDWEKTHYELQFRTLLPVVLVRIALFGVMAAMLIGSPPETASDLEGFELFSAGSGLVGYAVMGWALMRLGRGLYLAGGRSPLAFPRSYSIWPL